MRCIDDAYYTYGKLQTEFYQKAFTRHINILHVVK